MRMAIVHALAIDQVARWEPWRCTAKACRQGPVHLRRRAPGEDVWLIKERPGWVMAAVTPVCPACGASLTRAVTGPDPGEARTTAPIVQLGE
jgi:hypothetical protein